MTADAAGRNVEVTVPAGATAAIPADDGVG
jgi:hypothetical protein